MYQALLQRAISIFIFRIKFPTFWYPICSLKCRINKLLAPPLTWATLNLKSQLESLELEPFLAMPPDFLSDLGIGKYMSYKLCVLFCIIIISKMIFLFLNFQPISARLWRRSFIWSFGWGCSNSAITTVDCASILHQRPKKGCQHLQSSVWRSLYWSHKAVANRYKTLGNNCSCRSIVAGWECHCKTIGMFIT